MESLEARRLLSFGVTTGTSPTGQSTYVINNGGDVQFSIIKGGSTTSTLHLGDLTSIQYQGHELLASYAASSRYSHYEQGLGGATTVSYTINNTAGWILVTCDDSAETSGGVIQYFAVRKGDDNIYMASLPTDVNNGPGEGRFILYLDRTVFTQPEAPSDNNGSTGAIEGSDVYGHADGTTTSKFYNMNRRMIDHVYHGLAGTAGGAGVGAWMFMGNRETSSGGPFFKDIDYQATSGQVVEMYNCLFTGHTQTEPFRQGLKGPYALQLNGGSAPTTPSYSWLDGLTDSGGNPLIHGLIPASQRGSVSGVAGGVPSGHAIVVGLSNSTAQYWTYANAATGAYSISGVLPGTYTETLYDSELEVGRKTVTVTAQTNAAANIVDSYYLPSNPIFRIGTWDGTPLGFLNTQNDPTFGVPMISIMHPSDVRMANWNATPNFVIGSNTDAQWPAVQFMGVNNNQRLSFNLTSAQVQNLTLRVGITWAFSGARPRLTVNSGQSYAWTSTIPTASEDLNSRGITRGTWRGVNQVYTYGIPASAFRAGLNTIDLPLVSGSYVAGDTWLSPNVAYDAIDLVPTTAASTPSIASVTITPTGPINVNGTRTFTAVARDASGNVLNANFDWSASAGTIDANGNFVAPPSVGAATISVTASLTTTPGYSSTASSTSAIGTSNTKAATATISVQSIVVNRQIFYNNSKYDGNDPSANPSTDAAAIAPDKTALLPGHTAAAANYTNYSRGINGVIIDIASLPAATLTASDFLFKVDSSSTPYNWVAAPAPLSISVFPGQGVNGSSRIELIWQDAAIVNQWLQVTVNADTNTGLASPDIFYFGNLVGDTFDAPPGATAAVVNSTDALNVKANNLLAASITSLFDFDRNGVITATDALNCKSNNLRSLYFITV